ncbi:Exosome non-catalytic core component [Rhodotorula kratochvilovae]
MQSRTQLLTPSALRLDSRLPLELRDISFSILPSPPAASSSSSSSFSATAPPAGADGYALASHGLTSVAASVFGPREGQRSGPWSSAGTGQGAGGGVGAAAGGAQKGDRGTVNVEVGVAAWSERVGQGAQNDGGLRRGGKDRRTIELAAAVKNTFEPVLLLHLYPRSSIDMYLQILENDGSVLQAAINATSLALISAGLPLSDYVCALSLASYPSLPPSGPRQVPPFALSTPSASFSNAPDAPQGSGSTTLLDLVGAEEQGLPCLTVAVLPRSGRVTLVSLETRVGVGRFEEMLRWGVEGGKAVQGAMEEAVRTWAASLAAPQQTLGALFPGLGAAGGQGRGDEDDEMEV